MAKSNRNPYEAPWRAMPCPCGAPVCHRFGVDSGVFPMGAGFEPRVAQLVVMAPELLAELKRARSVLGGLVTEPADMALCNDIDAVIERAEDPRWLPKK